VTAPTKGGTPGVLRLRYEDEEQQHIFVMRKESIKIGRGGAGSGAWVDVQVMTSARVSREHCWIRTDANGRFFIQDVSTWGTAVNDAPIPAPERSADGAVVKPGAATELPAEARSRLPTRW
jgi:pSer/pThr/pTyr-binding forkhead associated (FHA) protein